jgi:hypothetical protein
MWTAVTIYNNQNIAKMNTEKNAYFNSVHVHVLLCVVCVCVCVQSHNK